MNSKFQISNSSLISSIEYDEDTKRMAVFFVDYYVDKLVYIGVPDFCVKRFVSSPSPGRFYLKYIKPIYSQSKSDTMADKIIKCSINVQNINKEWLFQGEKGVYLNLTVLYNEEQNQHGQNGMIVQDVPTDVYKKDKTVKGPILGNCKEFAKGSAKPEAEPGKEVGTLGVKTDVADDLPF